MIKTIRIRKHERGLLFRHGDFERLLAPGRHWLIGRGKAVERLDILGTRFDHKLIDVLIADAKVRDALHIVDVADYERALVWKDGRFAYILGPGRHALWRSPYALHVEL